MTTMLLSPRPSQLDRDAFIASYGEIYEHSPWIAAQSWDTGLGEAQDTPAGLAERLEEGLFPRVTRVRLEILNEDRRRIHIQKG